ncbi:hypothetical protein N665_0540s0010 [Sinapis alba]|nr:hypothetical protein N665_0540s0010 [Sinapis alba]
MSDLPGDLVEEILSRVPATSLKRLGSTCKRWSGLFKDRRFTEKHFCKAAKQSLVLTLKESSVFLASVSLNAASPISIEVKVPLSLKEVGIDNIFHCNGLLLCNTSKDDRIVVWNPCLGETRWIQIKPDYQGYSEFALGHDNNNKLCPAYKIMRRHQPYDGQFGVFEIYELSSDSWRVLDGGSLDWFIYTSGVSLKGNAYWLSCDRKDDSEFLTSFDFSRERFKRLCLPPTFQSCCRICLSVVREEQLSVLHQNCNTSKMEIWLTNKIDTEAALWTKFFTVDLHTHNPFSFFIDEEKKVVVCCNTAGKAYTIDKYCTESSLVVTTELSWIPCIYSYVPSLVQIPAKKKSKERNLSIEMTK